MRSLITFLKIVYARDKNIFNAIYYSFLETFIYFRYEYIFNCFSSLSSIHCRNCYLCLIFRLCELHLYIVHTFCIVLSAQKRTVAA